MGAFEKVRDLRTLTKRTPKFSGTAVDSKKLAHDIPPTPNQRKRQDRHESSYISVPTLWSLQYTSMDSMIISSLSLPLSGPNPFKGALNLQKQPHPQPGSCIGACRFFPDPGLLEGAKRAAERGDSSAAAA